MTVSISHIVQAVADAAEVTRTLVLTDETSPYLYHCRWLVFLLAQEMTIYHNDEIGRRLSRSAATVGQGATKIRKRLAADPQLAAIKARAEATLHARNREVS